MAIYSNVAYTATMLPNNTPANGRPNGARLTEGVTSGSAGWMGPNKFKEVNLMPPSSLTEGESYWFAFAWESVNNPISTNIFSAYNGYNKSANCIFSAPNVWSGGAGGSFNSVSGTTALTQSPQACWFRLS